MERSNYSEGSCRSANDQSLPSTRTTDDVSFYRALLIHHEKMTFVDDTIMKTEDSGIHGNIGETSEWESESTDDRYSHGQRNSSCRKIPRRDFRENTHSLVDVLTKSGSSRSRSQPSLYPTIVDSSFDNDHLDLRHGQQYVGPQRSRSDNTYNATMNNLELKPAAALSSSPPSCDFNDRSASSTDCADTANVLPRMSSFYQEALKEAVVIEKGDDELPFRMQQQHLQQQDISPGDERHSSRAMDGKDVVNICSPARIANGYGIPDNKDAVPSAPIPISPFYRAALENAALVEEEELSMLQHQHHKGNQLDQHATTTADTRDTCTGTGIAANRTIYTPSSFFRSALKEAMTAEQELESRGEMEQDEEDSVVTTAACDPTCSIQEGPVSIIVDVPELQLDLTIYPAANLDGRDREIVGARRSVMRPFSTSSTSSYLDTPSTTAVPSPPVLVRTTTNKSGVFQVQRGPSNASCSSFTVLPIEMEAIAPDRRSQSSINDSCAFSITRSSAMPHIESSILPIALKGGTHTARSDSSFFSERNTFHDSRDLHCSKNTIQDSKDDEIDEDLQMAIYLSRFESSAASSLNSEGTHSISLSTDGNRGEAEEESKNESCSDKILTSCDPTENKSQFLISQFKAMEECQRNKHKNCSSRNQNPGMSYHSMAPPSSGEDHFRSLRDAATSTPLFFGGRKQTRSRSLLETRGTIETRHAISNCNSRVVKCKGCKGRLQAPIHYSLVFCPKCQTVSPA